MFLRVIPLDFGFWWFCLFRGGDSPMGLIAAAQRTADFTQVKKISKNPEVDMK